MEITGNGIMLNSYPGQYPGVTKIQVVAEGSPEDADPYQEIVDAYFAEPDASEPASLQLQYRVPEAIVTASATMGSYTWEGTVPLCGRGGHLYHRLRRARAPVERHARAEPRRGHGSYAAVLPLGADLCEGCALAGSLLGTEDLAAAGEGEEVAVSAQDDAMTLTAEPGTSTPCMRNLTSAAWNTALLPAPWKSNRKA